jgi:predicted Zn-ribbon and HTH transcriptional regulator
MKKCPKCHSNKIELEDYMGAQCIICKECGYHEADELNISPEIKTSQREKGRYTPYKTGGGKRTK